MVIWNISVTFCALLVTSLWGHLRGDTQALAIGAIIEENDSLSTIAFEEALQNANLLIQKSKPKASSVDRLVGKIEYFKRGDSFQASRKVCDLVKNGVITILGPSDPQVANHIFGVCRQLNIPYLQTEWDQWQRTDAHTINVHPHYRSVVEAMESFVTRHNKEWTSLALIYTDESSLLKYEPILSTLNKPIAVRQWKISNENNKHIMKDLTKTTHRQFLVDIPYHQVREFLNMAALNNMTSKHFDYLFTDWDVHLLSLSSFQNGSGANLAYMSVLNTTPLELAGEETIKFKNAFIDRVAKTHSGIVKNTDTKYLPTRAALIYDAIMLFTHGLVELSKTRQIQSSMNISCTGSHSWSFGGDLIKAVNSIPKNKVFGLTREVHVTSGLRDDFYLSFSDITANGQRQCGYWTKSGGYEKTKLSSRTRREVEPQIDKKVLRVTTILDKPFVMENENKPAGIAPDDPRNWIGFCIDLLESLGKETNLTFKVHLVKDRRYGSKQLMPDKSEKWTGMIGELLDNQADMALAALTITAERERDMDFTTPFMSAGLRILYKRPEEKSFSFLQPFSQTVWCLVFAAYFLVSLLLYGVVRFSPSEWHPRDGDSTVPENQFSILNCFWLTMACLMHHEMTPKATSTRTMIGVWRFFILIIICSYTANLAVYLMTDRPAALSFFDAESLSLQTKVKYGILHGGSSYSYFERSGITYYRRMFDFMRANKEVAFVTTIDEGISRVSKDYAFLIESTMSEYTAQRNCSLMEVGNDIERKSYGIGFPTGSPYRDIMSEAILKLQKTQVIEKMRHYWWREYGIKNTCNNNQDVTSKGAGSLGIDKVCGLFAMLLLGMLLSIVIALLEFVIKRKTTSGKESTADSSKLRQVPASSSSGAQKPSNNLEGQSPTEDT